MAVEMVAAPVTSRVEFGEVPVADANLFSVAAGLPAWVAVEQAGILEAIMSEMLSKAVAEEGMDANAAFVCRFLLDAASALRQAVATG